MGFFDETLSKAKDVVDVAVKTTGEVAAKGKQRYDIAALKTKLSKNYEALGMICFKSIDLDNADEETRMTVMRIRENLKDIQKANEELAKMQNKRVCRKCSAYVGNKAVYCDTCGAKL